MTFCVGGGEATFAGSGGGDATVGLTTASVTSDAAAAPAATAGEGRLGVSGEDTMEVAGTPGWSGGDGVGAGDREGEGEGEDEGRGRETGADTEKTTKL